ncbi:hypothetical protein [Maritimibacter dapengensis]|uniref:Peptidase M48 domain-containing protein n=1 Tax=Maritimibacter dapengensis TaxID=2836868 RepID=A0ABS6SYW3_9RHOB|nr:hypothetical protein [Maritimibacter dapengensis]MBV7378160.1 hypothetical protein [Maritimibacter dapengensis]
MTALTQYDRLEATGLWRATPEAQRVEVIVSVGDATLTISDKTDRALSHWSLAAVHRLNVGKRPALFAPSDDPDEAEALEIADDEMIDAIEKVRKAILRRRPQRGRVRLFISAAVAFAIGLVAVTWLPGALTRQTLSVLPDVTRAETGAALLDRIRRVSGPPCDTRLGKAALAQLRVRALGPGSSRAVILSSGVETSAHLPGGIILLNRALVEDYEEPDVAAGFILAEHVRAQASDPMLGLLQHAGLIATVKLLTTGHISSDVLDSYAERLLTRSPASLDHDTLVARFDAARLRTSPYAYALDQTGETTLPLIEADPVPVSQAEPLIPDSAWVSLQGICGE